MKALEDRENLSSSPGLEGKIFFIGPDEGGFVQLITNLDFENGIYAEVLLCLHKRISNLCHSVIGIGSDELRLAQETDGNYLIRTRNYLSYVLTGENKKSYCPFVGLIEERNGYFVKEFPDHPNTVGFDKAIDSLEGKFKLISPSKTRKYQSTDATIVMLAFSHPEANTAEFGEKLDKIRSNYRQRFLDQGLMISQMHPYHEAGKKSGEAYSSRIPLLVVRRMHKPDYVFMDTEEARAAYSRFFGHESFGKFNNNAKS